MAKVKVERSGVCAMLSSSTNDRMSTSVFGEMYRNVSMYRFRFGLTSLVYFLCKNVLKEHVNYFSVHESKWLSHISC